MTSVMQPAEKTAPNVEKLTFTTAEVCQALSISVTTLWRFEKRNVLAPLPGFGRHKRFSVAAIRRLAEHGVQL